MPIEKIRRGKVSDEVFGQMKAFIASGEWKPGEKILSENDLAETFGVSRVSIRSALGRLGALGLVESRQGGGTFVGEATAANCMNGLAAMLLMDRRQLLDVLEFRRMVEVGGAGLAAERAGAADIAALRDNIARTRRSGGDPGQAADLDVEFHRLIARAARNAALDRVHGILRDILRNEQRKQHRAFGAAGALKFHPRIVDAVEAGDSAGASRIMDAHLASSIRKLHELELGETTANRVAGGSRTQGKARKKADTQGEGS